MHKTSTCPAPLILMGNSLPFLLNDLHMLDKALFSCKESFLHFSERKSLCTSSLPPTSTKELHPIILDEKQYGRMGGSVPRVSHIMPIRQLQRIRSFFLQHETAETMELVHQLRERGIPLAPDVEEAIRLYLRG